MVATRSHFKSPVTPPPYQRSETRVLSEIYAKSSDYLLKSPTKEAVKDFSTLIRLRIDNSVYLSSLRSDSLDEMREESDTQNSHKSELEVSGDNFQNYFYGFSPECFNGVPRSEFKSNPHFVWFGSSLK